MSRQSLSVFPFSLVLWKKKLEEEKISSVGRDIFAHRANKKSLILRCLVQLTTVSATISASLDHLQLDIVHELNSFNCSRSFEVKISEWNCGRERHGGRGEYGTTKTKLCGDENIKKSSVKSSAHRIARRVPSEEGGRVNINCTK